MTLGRISSTAQRWYVQAFLLSGQGPCHSTKHKEPCVQAGYLTHAHSLTCPYRSNYQLCAKLQGCHVFSFLF